MDNQSQQQDYGGWIDVKICEDILEKSQSFLCSVDGSDSSMVGLHYLTEGLMQQNRQTTCEVLHVYDDAKDYLPPALRPDAIRSVVESKLTGAVSAKRYKVVWSRKDGVKVAKHLCSRAKAAQADFAIMGFTGRKGRKDKNLMASNVQEAIQTCSCACIVIKDESPNLLPIKRPTKFVVSVSLNQASTKAFLDALRLSQPGDEIHVVYVKCFMERTDSDYTAELKEKYSAFFAGLKDGAEVTSGNQEGLSGSFAKFSDRITQFVLLKKQRRESTAQAVVRYADEIEADFVVVGTNTLRTDRGKKPLGSVSLNIIMEWERNFIVSHWLDVSMDLHGQLNSSDLYSTEQARAR